MLAGQERDGPERRQHRLAGKQADFLRRVFGGLTRRLRRLVTDGLRSDASALATGPVPVPDPGAVVAR